MRTVNDNEGTLSCVLTVTLAQQGACIRVLNI